MLAKGDIKLDHKRQSQSLEDMIAETMEKKKSNLGGGQVEDTGTESSKLNSDDMNFKYYHQSESEGNSHHSSSHHSSKKKKKKNKAKIVAITVLSIILAFAIFLGAAFWHYVSMINIKDTRDEIVDSIDIEYTTDSNSPQSDINKLKQQMRENFANTGLMQSDDVMNILLLGTDERVQGERGRSDSMMVVSINKATKEIFMTSFLRDMYVTIPEIGDSKLNHSYAYGGADLTIDTIQKNFKIKIDNYAQVNFANFVDIIDIVGGVDIELTAAEAEYLNNGLSAGMQHLNGEQALAYARIRYIDSDFGRTERQRNVLTDVITKARKLSFGKLNDFAEKLLPEITTNLSKVDIAKLLFKAPTYLKYQTQQDRIPIDKTWDYMTIDSMSVIGVRFKDNVNHLARTIYHYDKDLV